MVRAKVSAPDTPIDLSSPAYDSAFEDEVVESLVTRIQSCRQPLILVDGFTARFGVKEDINALVKLTSFPTLTTPFGKSVIDEDGPNYHGIYLGSAGAEIHQAWVQSCDLVLHFAVLGSEINTFGFTAQPRPEATVRFDKYSVRFGTKAAMQHLCTDTLLPKLQHRLQGVEVPVPKPYPEVPLLPREVLKSLPAAPRDASIDQYSLWLRISEFLQPGTP